MKKIIHSLLYLNLLAFPLTGQSEITLTEDGIELAKIHISINASLNGYIITQRCPACPDIKLNIDKNTAAIKQGKSVHLNQAKQVNGKFATIVFDPKTKRVKRIKW